jgi:hypothetical protein
MMLSMNTKKNVIAGYRSRCRNSNRKMYQPRYRRLVVRQYVGYDRLEEAALKALLAGVYRPLLPLPNFSCPP